MREVCVGIFELLGLSGGHDWYADETNHLNDLFKRGTIPLNRDRALSRGLAAGVYADKPRRIN
jgi:hypothetical protein